MGTITDILPEAFLARIRQQFPNEAPELVAAIGIEPNVSVRLNPAKFPFQPLGFETVHWCKNGLFLPQRPSFTLDPLFHAGTYYVQEASSMFLEQAFKSIKPAAPCKVLDLCAAPGGKSTHLLSLMAPDDLLVSNEVIRTRASILNENLRKWGHRNMVVTSSDPKDFSALRGFFDIVAVDAPCSGEGLFRRDRDAIQEWSVENTNLCAVRQRRILADIWPAIRTGGYLIYSTCTFNPAENEENLEWLTAQYDAESIRLSVQQEWHIDELDYNGLYGYRFLPHNVKGEGFFITVIRKNEPEPEFRFNKKGKSPIERVNPAKYEWSKWQQHNLAAFSSYNETIHAFPERWEKELEALRLSLKIVSYGLPIAEQKGKDFNPTPYLALSSHLPTGVFEQADLPLEDALKFLRKEDINLPEKQKGWILVSYLSVPLGFVKNLGNRTNNYFPKEWRIRMQTTDAQPGWYKSNQD